MRFNYLASRPEVIGDRFVPRLPWLGGRMWWWPAACRIVSPPRQLHLGGLVANSLDSLHLLADRTAPPSTSAAVNDPSFTADHAEKLTKRSARPRAAPHRGALAAHGFAVPDNLVCSRRTRHCAMTETFGAQLASLQQTQNRINRARVCAISSLGSTSGAATSILAIPADAGPRAPRERSSPRQCVTHFPRGKGVPTPARSMLALRPGIPARCAEQ